MTPARVMDELAGLAMLEPMVGACGSAQDAVARAHRRGEEPNIPERLLPGRFIMRLSAREREALSRLRSEDVACRDDVVRIR